MMKLGSDDAMFPLAFSERPHKALAVEAVRHEILTAKDRTYILLLGSAASAACMLGNNKAQ
jgi:hypothetical protein